MLPTAWASVAYAQQHPEHTSSSSHIHRHSASPSGGSPVQDDSGGGSGHRAYYYGPDAGPYAADTEYADGYGASYVDHNGNYGAGAGGSYYSDEHQFEQPEEEEDDLDDYDPDE